MPLPPPPPVVALGRARSPPEFRSLSSEAGDATSGVSEIVKVDVPPGKCRTQPPRLPQRLYTQCRQSPSQFSKGPAGHPPWGHVLLPLANGDTEASPRHPLRPPLSRGCCSWLVHTAADPWARRGPPKTQTGSTETPPSPAVDLGQTLEETTQPVLPIGPSKWGPLTK